MIRHLFTLMWNKKKQNLLLMTEILFSFLVLFGVFTLLVHYFHIYKQPIGIAFEQVWVINYNGENPIEVDSPAESAARYAAAKQTLDNMPEIESCSYASSNVPFSMNNNNGSVHYGNLSVLADNFTVDPEYPEVTGVKLAEGRWFSSDDDGSKYHPVVINQSLKEKLFPNETAVGKILGEKGGNYFEKVVGVAENVKDEGDYVGYEPAKYNRIDTAGYRWVSRILIKVKPGYEAGFENRLHKTMAGILKTSVEIEKLSQKKVSKNRITLIPMVILLLLTGFLLLNVALGLFGVLWYNINKRRAEIGLRRAVGASGPSVLKQIVAEALVLTTFAVALGSFFAVQFPLMHVFNLETQTYLEALLLALFFMYALVAICSLYPGQQAASIYPADALHED